MATTTDKTPAERLLEALGPVEVFHEDVQDIGDFGLPARTWQEDYLEPFAKAGPYSRLGPLEKVHAFWFAGMSCDGCTVSVKLSPIGAQPGTFTTGTPYALR